MNRSLRRALCLLATFLFAKCAVVALRIADGGTAHLASPWAPIAFVYQDLLATLCFATVDGALSLVVRRRPRIAAIVDRALWAAYVAAAVYTGFNVPVTRVFSTPLTWSLLGATGGALWDSIAFYLTRANLAAFFAVCAFALLIPRLIRRSPSRRALSVGALIAFAVLAASPAATGRVESIGLHRNALAALAASALDDRLVRAPAGDPDARPLPVEGDAMDLRSLAGAARGKNVVWVVLESTAAQYLRPYGAARDPTPRLTALAEHAVIFDGIYAAYPESIKGLFSVLCSTWPAAHTSADRYTERTVPCQAVASRFASGGYRTALFHSGRFVYLGMQGVIDDRGFQDLVDAGGVGGRFASSFGVDESSTVKKLLEWIDAGAKDRPFFAMYLPIAGHHPYSSPGEGPRPFGEGSEIDRYASDLYRGDLALGALQDGLAARGLADRTLWVVMGDHGEAFFQHEGNFAHTLFLYEENVHVPLIVAGVTDAVRRAPQIGDTIDVAPTLLDLVGLPPPPRWQGRTLLDPSTGVARFYTDHTLWQIGLRSGPWKFIHEVDSGRSKLFDLSRDPGEKENVAAADPERVRRYRDHLAGWGVRQRARILGYRALVGEK